MNLRLALFAGVVLSVNACTSPAVPSGQRNFTATFGGLPKGTTCTVLGAAGTVKQVKAPLFGDPGVSITGSPEVGTIECRAPSGDRYQTRLNAEVMAPDVNSASAIVTSGGYVQGGISTNTQQYSFTGNTKITKL